MPGVNCSVYDCGTCRRTNGIQLRLPLTNHHAHRRDEWLGEIKKTREMDQDFRRQINDDKIYTCEKHFDPDEIEICKYRVMNSFTATCTLETSSHILRTIVYEIMEITGDHWISSVGFSSWWNFLSIWEGGRRALRIDLETTSKMFLYWQTYEGF